MKRNTKKARRISKHNKKHNKTNRRARHTTKRVRGGEGWFNLFAPPTPEAKSDTPQSQQPEEQPVPITGTPTVVTISDKDLISKVLEEYKKRIDRAIDGKEFKDNNIPEEITYAKEFLSDDENKNRLMDEILKNKDISPYDKLWEDIGEYTIDDITELQNELESTGLEKGVFAKLKDIIYKYKDADNIVTKITELLGKSPVKQQLTDEQIENIKNILNNKDKKNTLGSLSTKFASGIQSLGSWLVPQPSGPQNEYNETKVHFLWYPRMYPRYRKGDSNAEKTIKYGDFMVYIEPEKYASTLEFINQTTSGVDDLLTNILNGYQHPSVIPDPVRHTISKIQNNQPQLDKEALVNPNLKKPSPQEKK
jgi:hypothetical protein